MTPRVLRSWPPSKPLATLGAVIVVGGALMGVGGDASAKGLGYVTVRRGEVTAAIGAAGSVQSGRVRDLGFGAAGTVTKVNVRSGQTVKTGQVLAEIDNTKAAEQVNAAVAALASAQQAAANVGTTPTASPCPSGAKTPAPSGTRTKTPPPSVRPPGPPPTFSVSPAPNLTPTPSAPSRTGPPKPVPTGTTGRPSATPTKSTPGSTPSRGGKAPATGGCSGGPGKSSPAPSSAPSSGNAPTTQQQADANVVKAQATLSQARRALDGTRIVAPTAGTILSVAGQVGTVVSGPGSSGFITIGNLDELQVQANFSESDVTKLKIGQSATITLAAGNGGPFNGTVSHIEPAATITGSLVLYGVEISFDQQPGRLLIGQTATVQVIVQDAQDALYVPSAAVHPGPNGTYTVQVRRGGTARTQTVRIGVHGDQYAEIRSGLTDGEQVKLT